MTNLEAKNKINIVGKINTIDSAAVNAGLPDEAVEKTSSGKVIILPAPIKKDNKY